MYASPNANCNRSGKLCGILGPVYFLGWFSGRNSWSNDPWHICQSFCCLKVCQGSHWNSIWQTAISTLGAIKHKVPRTKPPTKLSGSWASSELHLISVRMASSCFTLPRASVGQKVRFDVVNWVDRFRLHINHATTSYFIQTSRWLHSDGADSVLDLGRQFRLELFDICLRLVDDFVDFKHALFVVAIVVFFGIVAASFSLSSAAQKTFCTCIRPRLVH